MTFSNPVNLGSNSSKVQASSLDDTPSSAIAVGEIALVTACCGNITTTQGASSDHSVSDDSGNTWTKIIERTKTDGVADDGVTGSIWFSKITTEIGTADRIIINYGGSVRAKAMGIAKTTVGAGNSVQVAGSVGVDLSSGTAPLATVAGLTSKEYLFYPSLFWEGIAGNYGTEDVDYTTVHMGSTSGGAQISNVGFNTAYRIATLTGDTYGPTLSTGRDYFNGLPALEETGGPPPSIVDIQQGISNIAQGGIGHKRGLHGIFDGRI